MEEIPKSSDPTKKPILKETGKSRWNGWFYRQISDIKFNSESDKPLK